MAQTFNLDLCFLLELLLLFLKLADFDWYQYFLLLALLWFRLNFISLNPLNQQVIACLQLHSFIIWHLKFLLLKKKYYDSYLKIHLNYEKQELCSKFQIWIILMLLHMTGIQIHKDSQPRTNLFLSILSSILISLCLLQNSFICLSKHWDHQHYLDSINQILFRYKFIRMKQKH